MTYNELKLSPQFFYVGDYFALEKHDGTYLYKVENRDPLKYIKTGKLAPGQSIREEDETLVPPEGQIYTFLIGVKGAVRVYVYQPPAVSRFGLSTFPGWISELDSPYEDPNPMTQIFTFLGYKFSYEIKNMIEDENWYILKFIGYKYLIKEVAQIKPYERILSTDIPEKIIREMIERYYLDKLPAITLSGIVSRK